MKSLGFFTKKNEIITFNEIRILSEPEWENYLESLENIYKIDEKISLFHMIYINYHEFYEYMEYITKSFYNTSQLSQTNIKTHVNNLNCKLNNFLLSIRLFLDHFERKLKNEYGKNSDEFKKFNNETSKLYDNYFSYRFLYNLRNYVQHKNLAISQLEISKTEGKIKLLIALNRDELLSDNKWKQVIKNDLMKQPEFIEIFSLMREMLYNLKKLTKCLIKDETEKIDNSMNFLKKLINEIKNNNAPIIYDAEDNKITYYEFPLELMKFIDYIQN